jgi:hypothetical protein
MSRTARSLVVVAALVALVTLALAGLGPEPAPAAKASPPWRVFAGMTFASDRLLFTSGWASNRVWAGFESEVPRGTALTLASARVSGRTLTGFSTSRVPTDVRLLMPILEGELAFSTSKGLLTAPLLASGRLGEATPVSDDLQERAGERVPDISSARVEDGVRVGGRNVWALTAGSDTNRGKTYVLACCARSGEASELILRKAAWQIFFQLGVDTRGRLWLAWLDTTGYGAARGAPLIVELDPVTLALRSKPIAAPMLADRLLLACAARCRIVAQSSAGDLVSWAPGERSPTRMVRGAANVPVRLLDASYRSGDLTVAFVPPAFVDGRGSQGIRVARGDARGARARVLGTIAVPNGWPLGRRPGHEPFQGGEIVGAVLVPRGLVVFVTFSVTLTGSAVPPTIATVLPLGR